MTWRVPSAELAARIQRWIDETDGGLYLGNWPRRVFKEKNALLLTGNLAFFWGLTPGGELLRVDTDDVSLATEPETDPRCLYAVLASASEGAYPELRELVPEQPDGVKRCPRCDGTGMPPERSDICLCGGLGWFIC